MRTSLLSIAVAAIVGGGIATAAVIGGGAAVAQDDNTVAADDRPMPEGLKDVLRRLVDDDVITEEQAEAVGDALREHAARFKRPYRGHGLRGYSPRASLEVVAGSLGIDETDLLEALREGQSIAELAEAQGVALATIVDALMAQHEERISDAVADGKISDERAAELREQLEQRISRFLEGEIEFERKRGRGFGGFGGFGDRGPRFRFRGGGEAAGVAFRVSA